MKNGKQTSNINKTVAVSEIRKTINNWAKRNKIYFEHTSTSRRLICRTMKPVTQNSLEGLLRMHENKILKKHKIITTKPKRKPNKMKFVAMW